MQLPSCVADVLEELAGHVITVRRNRCRLFSVSWVQRAENVVTADIIVASFGI